MPVEIVSHTEDIKERLHAALSDAAGDVGEEFLSFTRGRFAREGDGWADLSERTQDEREEQGFGRDHPILKRLGILEGALTRGNDGNLFEHVETRVTVGISGGSHPGYSDGSAGASIESIALQHQLGIGIPARVIFVFPDEGTIQNMTTIIANAATTAIG